MCPRANGSSPRQGHPRGCEGVVRDKWNPPPSVPPTHPPPLPSPPAPHLPPLTSLPSPHLPLPSPPSPHFLTSLPQPAPGTSSKPH
ncbi:unnamed protein product [Closterium sp. NIES-53]